MTPVSAADTGLSYLKNAILETLSQRPRWTSARPAEIAKELGLAAGGSPIVQSVLVLLSADGHVQPQGKVLWELTPSEKEKRGVSDA